MKKAIMTILMGIFVVLCIIITSTNCQATPKTSGKDANGILWIYDKDTKTITISGTGATEDYIDFAERKKDPAWWDWKLETEHIVIEEGITEIGGEYFSDFSNVTSIQLPETCVKIGDEAFWNCSSIKNITLPTKLKYIGDAAFDGCRALESIQFPENITYIGSYGDCDSLEEIIIPDSVKVLPDFAFTGCKNLKTIKLPKNLKTLGSTMFRSCFKLKEITLPKSLKVIEEAAFEDSYLETIVIPENVTTIKSLGDTNWGVFQNCKKLKTVKIKSKKLKKVYKGSFCRTPKGVTIQVPKSKLKKYRKMFYKAGLSKKIKVKKLNK